MSNLNNSQFWQGTPPQAAQQLPAQYPAYQQQQQQAYQQQQLLHLIQQQQQQQQLALSQQLLLQQGTPVKIYIKPGDEIRKFRLAVNAPWSLQTIKNKVVELTSKNPELADTKFTLSYLDEESDWIRLENDEDWKEFTSVQRLSIKIKAKFATPVQVPKSFTNVPPQIVEKPLLVEVPVPQPLIQPQLPLAQQGPSPVPQQPIVPQQQQQQPVFPQQVFQPAPSPVPQPIVQPAVLQQQPIAPSPVPQVVEPVKPVELPKPVVVQPIVVEPIVKPVEQPKPVVIEPPKPVIVPQPVVDQASFLCDSCKKPINGTRYNCSNCQDFDLCTNCYPFRYAYHDQSHVFQPLDQQQQEPAKPVPIVEQPKPAIVQPVAEVPKPVIVQPVVEQPKPVVVEPVKPVEVPKPVVVQPPAEDFKYENEEKLLINMGLDDKQKVRTLLNKFNGNVNRVVDEYFTQ